MNTNTVFIKPSTEGAIINIYKSNPKFGYIQLASEEQMIDGGWVRTKSRNCLLRAEVAVLEKFVQTMGRTGTLPGRIVVREFLESELPENFQSRLNKSIPYEDAVEPFIKRAGKDGIELTVGGERILRFTDYDPSGKEMDKTVSHDNVSAVKEAMSEKSVSAEFPA